MKTNILTLLSFLVSSICVQAQIIDKTEDRAKEKTNQRIDRKIDSGIDSGLDAIEGLFKKKKVDQSDVPSQSSDEEGSATSSNSEDDAAASKAMLSLFGGGGNTEVADHYEFDHSIDMKMENFDKKGKLTGANEMVMLIAEEGSHSGMITNVDGNNSLIIFDLETEQMISLVDASGQKIGIVMPFGSETFDAGEENVTLNKQPVFTQTGQRKTISGYACSEYKLENVEGEEESEIFLWMTKESDMNWMNAFGAMSKSNKDLAMRGSVPSNYPEGAVVEMVSVSQNNGEKSVITVERFNRNKEHKVATAGYTFMNMGAN